MFDTAPKSQPKILHNTKVMRNNAIVKNNSNNNQLLNCHENDLPNKSRG